MDPHFEKYLVINNRELNYKGIFRFDQLVSVINEAIEARGYEKSEKASEELVQEEGRKTYIELRPFKDFTSYARLLIKIRMTIDFVKEKVEVVEGRKVKFDQGDIHIAFDSWLLTDYRDRWGMKPWLYFLKMFINKYVYRWPLEKSFHGQVASDTAYIYGMIKKLLNAYKLEIGRIIPEEENIRKQVTEDVRKEVEKAERELQESAGGETDTKRRSDDYPKA